MTDQKDDAEEIDRAERIKRLREGEAEPRRRRRRPEFPDDPEELEEAIEEADVEVEMDHEGPAGDEESVALPPDAPEDLTVASMYLTESLKGKIERVEEHLHLRYGFEYDNDLEGPRHVRPLALYLGVRQLEKLEIGEVYALLREIDQIEEP